MQIDSPYLRRLAEIESGMNPMAQNPNSSARGLFQFINSTGKQYGLDPAQFGTDAYTQAEIPAAEKLTQDNRAFLTKALGREPTDGELYLAHQQGASGAAKILANPNAPAVQVVGQDAVLNNAGTPDMTAQAFANKWVDKFNSAYQDDAPLTPEEEAELAALEEEPLTPEEQAELAMLEAGNKPAQPQLTPAQEFANESPIQRTLGRTARSGLAGLSSLADLALLVPKTASLAGSMAYRNLGAPETAQALENFGRMPSMRDTTLGIIDKATGGKLQPTGTIDKVGDFAGELISSSVPFMQAPTAINAATKTPPTAGTALKSVLDPETALNQLPAVQARAQIQKLTADQLRKASSSAYTRATEQGGTITASKVDSFIDDMAKTVVPKDEKVLSLGAGKASKELLEEIKNIYGGKPLTLEEAQNFDEFLTEKIDDYVVNGVVNKEGNRIQKIQQAFRDTIQNLGPEDVDNAEGFEALKKGRELWARSRRLADVERVLLRAEYMDQPANAVKTGLRTILTNPSKRRGYSKEEIKAMEKAMKTGLQDDLLRTFGGRLMNYVGAGIGSTMGGPIGAAAGAAATTMGTSGARALGTARQIDKTTALMDLIAGAAPKMTQQSTPLLTQKGALAAIGATGTQGQQMLPKPPLQITVQPNSLRGY